MKNGYLQSLLLLAAIVLMAFQTGTKKPLKVYLIGDSTIAEKSERKYPETGWGVPFAYFFDDGVKVENHARNGRSTKSFLAENRWQPVVDQLQQGDWVFIQFGHNDEVVTKKTYSTPEEFKANLKRYVQETRNKGAHAVLLTPVARRKFDEQGKLQDTHAAYSALVREVAQALQVPLIDLDKKSQELLQALGPEQSKLLYLHLNAGEHPNYPDGVVDDTHFSELGARKMAQLVLADVKALNLPLADRIYKPAKK